MAELPSVSVVIPNYNGRALLARNLPHVCRAAECYPGRCRVIAVDDASTEHGVERTLEAFPTVTLVRHARNAGFSVAIASGVAEADTEIVVLLNSDVCPAEDFLAPLVRPFEVGDVFAVSPLILHEDGAPYRESWNRRRFRGGKWREVPWTLEELMGRAAAGPVPTLYASGGSVALRRSRFRELGGFAALFRPYYVEDLDLGVRAWRQGWRVVVEPRSRVVHQTQGSIGSEVPRARVKRVQHRNRFLFEWAHFAPARLLLYRAPYYVKQFGGRVLRGDGAYVAGFGAAIARLPAALGHRRRVNAAAVRTLEQVLDLVD
ncbi:MAG: glycosyltransferase family 2 protein [Pseudomonadota bacterium]